MQHKNGFLGLVVAGVILIAAAGLWLATAPPAKAQCGSQASSCKACHEVQGKMPVNNDGTAWHTSHAFGDFCYICHAGNNQAKGEAEAHMGMEPPLADIKASCQQCHPSDLQARAEVYAVALGVELGDGSAPPPAQPASGQPASGQPASGQPAAPAASGQPGGAAPVSSAASSDSAFSTNNLAVDDPNLVDYAQRYNEIVLGKRPVNTGNTILLVMIGMLAVGGGGFVFYKEILSKLSLGVFQKVEGGHPADVVEMLPAIENLKPQDRMLLKNMLENPQKAQAVLKLIDTLGCETKAEEQAQ